MESVLEYVPMDRRLALAAGRTLPEHATGALLVADIAGSTPLTEALVRTLGAQRGVEELSQLLNVLYESLTAEVDRYQGSVIGFSGDGLLCWFDDAVGQGSAPGRAVAAALGMQAAFRVRSAIAPPAAPALALAFRTAVVAGPVRRFLAGDPAIQWIEVLAGSTLHRLAAAEAQARPGEVVLDVPTAAGLGAGLVVREWRAGPAGERSYAVVAGLAGPVAPQPWPALPPGALSAAQIRPWLLPAVYARLHSGRGAFLTELRPAVALFLRFADLDYDGDPSAGAQLDAFIRWVQGVLQPYDGALLQLTLVDKGSYLYAAFGAPTAHGDDALRAAGAALDLLVPPAALAYAGAVQIGISAGQARVGSYGGTTRTYGVLAEATNRAARLMLAAAPGQILADAALAPALARRYELAPRDPIPVKGVAAPVPIVAVLSRTTAAVQGQIPVLQQEPRYAPQLFGREAERAAIGAHLAALQEGRGHILGLAGAAGLGKSRLLAEAIRQAQELHLPVYGGAAQLTGTQRVYLAWQPIYRALFGLDSAAPAPHSYTHDYTQRLQMEQVAAALATLDPALLPRLPLLAPLLDLPLPDNDVTRRLEPRTRKEALESLLLACWRARAAQQPLVLVLDDAHWLDALSWDLLLGLSRLLPALPILVLLAYRPLADRADEAPGSSLLNPQHSSLIPHHSFAALPQATEIALPELAPAALQQLIAQRLAPAHGPQADVPLTLVSALHSRVAGNPLYVEELLNYLQARGLDLTQATDLDGIDLPGSLTSLILSRLDQLTIEQQTTLKVASIIGRVFPFAWLWGVYPALGTPDRVRADLEALDRLDITPLDRPEPELRFLFKHIVIQEVIYESIPYRQRAQLHEQLAAWLEAQPEVGAAPGGGPGAPDLLAYHYGRSTNTARQRVYFRQAGDAAAARYANATAIQYYERLLVLLPAAEQGPILLALAGIEERISAWESAVVRYEAALAVAQAENDPWLGAQACAGMGGLEDNRGQYAAARDWLGRARAEFAALGDAARALAVLASLAIVLWRQGDLDGAAALAAAIRPQAEAQGDHETLGAAVLVLANVQMGRGNWVQAQALWEESLAFFRATGNQMRQAAITGNLGLAALEAQDYPRARRFLTAAMDLYALLGIMRQYAVFQAQMSKVLLADGDQVAAVQVCRQSLGILRTHGTPYEIVVPLMELARLAVTIHPSAEVYRYAARLAGGVAGMRTALGSPLTLVPNDQARMDALLARARAILGDADAQAAWDAGYAMPWQEVAAYALDEF